MPENSYSKRFFGQIAAETEGFACICALRETAQIKEFTGVRAGSCTRRRRVRLHIRILPETVKKEEPPVGVILRFIGGDGGIRTLDLTDANRTLSQLSYAPEYRLFSMTAFVL